MGTDLILEYNIPIQATNRAQWRELRGWGHTKLYRVMYADDLCACFTSVEAAKRGLLIIEREFKRYGLVLSRPKSETMAVNDGDLANKSSILSLDDDKIKNVLEFKYHWVMPSPVKPIRLIEHRITSATAKFYEMKKVLTNGRFAAKTTGRYMNTFVRSRLCYIVATWNYPDYFVKKLDTVCYGLLRKVVINGFKCKVDSMHGIRVLK